MIEEKEQTNNHWTQQEIELVTRVESYKELYGICRNVLLRIPTTNGIGLVSGPISTGGLGSIQLNLQRFDNVIKMLRERGTVLFDQMPFEGVIKRLNDTIKKEKGYSEKHHVREILDELYWPLMSEKNSDGKTLITTLYRIPGWVSSIGAKQETEWAYRLHYEIVNLTTKEILTWEAQNNCIPGNKRLLNQTKHGHPRFVFLEEKPVSKNGNGEWKRIRTALCFNLLQLLFEVIKEYINICSRLS